MKLSDVFEIASGTITGFDHVISSKNNQDGLAIYADDDQLIAAVCDGCSGSKKAEVGSNIAARLIVNLLRDNHSLYYEDARALERLKDDFLIGLCNVAKELDTNYRQVLIEYFQFTTVVMVLNRIQNKLWIFSIGDGAIAVNGEFVDLGPFPDNAPPYVVYNMLDTSLAQDNPELLDFRLNYELELDELQSAMIGSDGVIDLVNISEHKMPGKQTLVGPLSQFWENDLFFRNRDALRRKLVLTSRESIKLDRSTTPFGLRKEPGLVPDDTTMFIIRRKKPSEEGEVT